jgi:hypothetical protein
LDVARGDARHDRAVGDAEIFHPADPQFGVHDGEIVPTRLGGAA